MHSFSSLHTLKMHLFSVRSPFNYPNDISSFNLHFNTSIKKILKYVFVNVFLPSVTKLVCCTASYSQCNTAQSICYYRTAYVTALLACPVIHMCF